MSNCFVCLQNVTDPSGYHPKCAKSLFGSKTVPTLDIELAKLHTAALAMVGKISISGIQKKISLNISVDRKTLYVAAGKSYYILTQLPQQLALEVEKDWICDFFSHYISLVRILVGNRNPIMSSRIF